ncbi:MAG: MarR family transcriptional regulator [Myxococcota bacterium]|nr:MarR family transcriptional regulator [Myxococcota bacterium]
MPQDSHSALGYSLLRSVRRIVRRVSLHSKTLAKETGLTVPQLLCLRAIHELDAEEITLALVADHVGLSRGTVSPIIERLVQAGLVSRERSTRDRRRLHLTLTAKGEQRLESGPSPLQDRFLTKVAALPLERQAALLSSLEEIAELMDASEVDAAPMLVPGSKPE